MVDARQPTTLTILGTQDERALNQTYLIVSTQRCAPEAPPTLLLACISNAATLNGDLQRLTHFYKKLVVLAIDFRQSSKIGMLILMSPQIVSFLSAPVTGAYGRNCFVRRSVYRSKGV